MLYKKSNYKSLKVNQIEKYLSKHSQLISKFSQSLNKKRVLTHFLLDYIIKQFSLYKTIIINFNIAKKNINNINKKDFAISVANRVKVIYDKDSLEEFMI